MRRLPILLALVLVGCGRGPKVPSEDEARAAYRTRESQIAHLEDELKKEIAATGLTTPRVTCTTGEDVCLKTQRARDEAVLAAQKRLQTLLESMNLVCAEVTVTSGGAAHHELRASIATCPPGRRGDSIAPTGGFSVGELRIGRGVYFQKSDEHHPGIAIEHTFTQGAATARLELYLYSDGTTPTR